MPCFHPLHGWWSIKPNEKGNHYITFDRKKGYPDRPQDVPCGQCVGCRLERSRQWALRCQHEASLYEHNCFITLTYDDAHLPSNRSLSVREFQLFMKRLRKRFGSDIRFYHAGEYGETFGRPHYHACLFNFEPPDMKFYKVRGGNRMFTSEIMTELWGKGIVVIGSVTFESAAYVARYIMKKVTGDAAQEHYERINLETGEVYDLKPEYTTMSRRPGIGKGWYDKFKGDVFPSDYLVVNNKKVKPPKYYDKLFEVEYPSDFENVKRERVIAAKEHLDNNSQERLNVREQVQFAKLTKLVRHKEI